MHTLPHLLARASCFSFRQSNRNLKPLFLWSQQSCQLSSDASPQPSTSSSSTIAERSADIASSVSTDVAPIEVRSLAKALFVNKIDTAMLSYPEFAESEDVTALNEFTDKINRFFRDKVDSREIDFTRQIPDEVFHGFKRLGVFGLEIPKSFGGLGLTHKSRCQVYETLSKDWSIFSSIFAHNELAVKAILLFGTDDQKALYLPRLARGESVAAFCMHEDGSGHDIASISSQVTRSSVEESQLYLNGVKHWVTNAQKLIRSSCFIIDKSLTPNIEILPRRNTFGLRGLDVCDVRFNHVALKESAMLGDYGAGFDISRKTIELGQHFWGSAVAGCIKRFLTDVAKHCNATKRFDVKLADNNAMKKKVGEMALGAYALESMSYYISGLLDEDDNRDVEIEGSMIKAYARNILRQSIMQSMDIIGAASVMLDNDWERYLRDIATLNSFIRSNDYLNGLIAISAVMTWASDNKPLVEQLTNPQLFPLAGLKHRAERSMWDHKYKHYINEYVHPSLEPACRSMEDALMKFDKAFTSLMRFYGKDLEDEHFVLERISLIGQLMFAMICILSRSSRAYSIGLRQGDIELFNTITYCAVASSEVHHLCDQLMDPSIVPELDLHCKKVADDIFRNNGYELDSPLAKNW